MYNFADENEEEYWNERSAVYEYLAHFPRKLSEQKAWLDVVERRKKDDKRQSKSTNDN